MVKITNVTLDVPLGTKIQDLISALKKIEETYHNVSVGSFDYDSMVFNIKDEEDVAED